MGVMVNSIQDHKYQVPTQLVLDSPVLVQISLDQMIHIEKGLTMVADVVLMEAGNMDMMVGEEKMEVVKTMTVGDMDMMKTESTILMGYLGTMKEKDRIMIKDTETVVLREDIIPIQEVVVMDSILVMKEIIIIVVEQMNITIIKIVITEVVVVKRIIII